MIQHLSDKSNRFQTLDNLFLLFSKNYFSLISLMLTLFQVPLKSSGHLMRRGTVHLALERQWFIQITTRPVCVLHQVVSEAVRITFTKPSAVHQEHVSSSDKAYT